MRLNRLDLNLIVCLDALLAERNVSRAAARVFVSQPAMSIALKRLRTHFEDELLVRIGRDYELTPFAIGLQKSVRDAMLQMRAISDVRPTFDADTSDRKISIEASDYVSTVYMGEVFRRAYALAPRMRFDLQILSARFIEHLDSGEIDLLVIPKPLSSVDHPRDELFSDTFSCVVWRDNHLVKDHLSLEQYLAFGHVVAEWDNGRLAALDQAMLADSGLERRREIAAPSFSLAPHFVIGTQRLATIQTRLAHHLAARWPIRVLPCPVETPVIVETVQWHKYQEQDPAIRWFLDLMRSVARSMDAPAPIHRPAVRRKNRAKPRGVASPRSPPRAKRRTGHAM